VRAARLIDHVEAFSAGDDSVEFFRGTVSTKYMTSIFSDTTTSMLLGYRGGNQF
jgi:hypothetical protein